MSNKIHAYSVLHSGVLRMTAWLQRQGYIVNEQRVRRLVRTMGLMAIYPSPKTSRPAPAHQIYRLAHGFVFLVAIMDWFSRYVLSWRLSNSLETQFCVEALDHALAGPAAPEIFTTDQGAQFTSLEFTSRLRDNGVRISMDGRGRALDNAFVERLWRSVQWEEVYVNSYQSMHDAMMPGTVCIATSSTTITSDHIRR
jgi:putative transposase